MLRGEAPDAVHLSSPCYRFTMHLLDAISLRTIIDELAARASQGRQNVASTDLSLAGIATLLDRCALVSAVRIMLDQGFDADASLPGSIHDRGRRNRLGQRADALKAVDLLETAEIRGAKLPLGQSMLLIDGAIGFVGNCAMTSDGLGLAPPQRLGFVQRADEPAELAVLAAWFEAQWQVADPGTKAALDAAVSRHARHHGPLVPYRVTLHRLFADMADGSDERGIVDAATGIAATKIWSKLYRFQRDGVIGAIDKLDRFGGCIIADSVGLGKTFEALAVIKYYELRNDRVLVLAPCPPSAPMAQI